MIAIHTVGRLAARDGGPARSVAGLCRALADGGVDVELVTGELEEAIAGPLVRARAPVRVDAVGSFPAAGRPLPRPLRFARTIAARADATDVVVHDHGLWLPSNHAAARVARRRGVPRIVSPRGMLSAWALRYRGGRKRLLWSLFQRRDLERAAALHATSDTEAEEIRAVGLERPVAVVANGVEMPESLPLPPVGDGRRRRLLFLSRIHPKKGLENLIDAWARLRPAGWDLLVAGPDETGHRSRIERRVRESGLGREVEFRGEVPDDRKWELYQASDAFVLPTHSENFGLVVAEALAAGLPVVTTRAAPWRALEERRCGWWVEDGSGPLENALRKLIALSDEERRAMGRRGRALVRERYAWDRVAREMIEVYRWMLGIRPEPPECVRLN